MDSTCELPSGFPANENYFADGANLEVLGWVPKLTLLPLMSLGSEAALAAYLSMVWC